MEPVKFFKTGVYLIRNKVNGKVYVGSAARSLLRRFRDYRHLLPRGKCHNRHLQRAWNKYGKHSFAFTILERCSAELCIEREQYWLDELKAADPKYGYNSSPTAGSPRGARWKLKHKKVYSAEARAKVAAANRGRKHSEETKAKMRIKMKGKNKGKKRTLEQIQVMAELSRGRKHSEETKAKIAAANTGKEMSEETRKKMSEAAKIRAATAEFKARVSALMAGRKHTEEAKAKISAGNKGKVMSQDARRKISEAAKLRHAAKRFQKLQLNLVQKLLFE